MALRIRWSLRAVSQFEGICEYISRDSPRYASVFASRINNIVSSLPEAPRLGRVVPEYRDPILRERIYQGYRIVYRLKPDAIEIVAICHGARLLAHALEER